MKLIDIKADEKAVFLERPNRFLGRVKRKNGEKAEIHVHDPGRLKELLYKGNKVLIRHAENKKRKTKWDLIAAKSGNDWVLVNSALHRVIAERILGNPRISPFGKIDSLKPEVKTGSSRIDFLLTKDRKRIWVETKGCTLKKGKTALFPDAPTSRGTRHIHELMEVKHKGDNAAVLFLVFVDAEKFKANSATDSVFAQALKKAFSEGVEIHAEVLEYKEEAIYYKGEIPLVGI